MAAALNTSSLVSYACADHLNIPRAVVNTAGNLRWSWVDEPFGTTPANSNPAAQGTFIFNRRFPGRFYDAESGMHYNVNRDYVPGVGRYAQSDPVGLSGGLNTYAYVGSNPLSSIDPQGLAKMPANSAHCSALRKKISNLNNELDSRWSELEADPLGLPERIGPGEALSATKRGHRTLINSHDSNLRKYEQRYRDECDDEPPPPPAPSADICGNGCKNVLKAVRHAVTGAIIFVTVLICATS